MTRSVTRSAVMTVSLAFVACYCERYDVCECDRCYCLLLFVVGVLWEYSHILFYWQEPLKS